MIFPRTKLWWSFDDDRAAPLEITSDIYVKEIEPDHINHEENGENDADQKSPIDLGSDVESDDEPKRGKKSKQPTKKPKKTISQNPPLGDGYTFIPYLNLGFNLY